MRRSLRVAVVSLACLLAPLAAVAETRRQAAGACDVYAPVLEDPGLAWDYWWSGPCVDGLASGAGFLLEYMRNGGFGDVYAMEMSGGRAAGEVRAYGPAFLATEWNVRAGSSGENGDWPESWRPVDAHVSRFALPAALQAALDRFAGEVGHPQMPALPVMANGARCLRSIELESGSGGVAQKLDVAAFIGAHASYEAAWRDALLQAMSAQEGRTGSAARQQLARERLALAAAVAGCR